MSFFDDYDPEKASTAWPVGSYEAAIVKVEESLSKEHGTPAHGDPMLVVTYEIYGAAAGSTRGQKITLKDFFTNPPDGCAKKGSLWKLRALCTAVGLLEKFKAKTLKRRDLEGKNLIVNLSSSNDPQYGEQNKVDSYGKLEHAPAGKVAAGAEDDDVPF